MSEADQNLPEIELPAVDPSETLKICVDGFEGPLDLLLTLARDQKVDLAKISILRLAEQYLEFVETAKSLNLDLAADYLVMAAWLAYLKSRLLLPQPTESAEQLSAGEMAARLRWRLQRLEAMRDAAARLMARDRLGRDIFARGAPEPIKIVRTLTYVDSLYDLLTAYGVGRAHKLRGATYQPLNQPIVQIEEARARLERMLGKIPEWSGLRKLVPHEWYVSVRRNSAIAGMLLACLEMTREGRLQMRQMAPFEEIYVKDKAESAS